MTEAEDAAAEQARHDAAVAAFAAQCVVEVSDGRWTIERYPGPDGAPRWSAAFHHNGFGRDCCGFRSREAADTWRLQQTAQITEERQRRRGDAVQESWLARVEADACR